MSDQADALRARARAALPPVDGELRLDGLRAPVRVVRDRWGVPHITAQSEADLFLAQGFVVASERLFQLELSLRLATGRLSEVFSGLTLGLDRFARTVGWNRTGHNLAARLDERSVGMLDAMVSGWRAWMATMPARPPEYDVLDLDPWLPDGAEARAMISAATVFMAWSLSGNWDLELLRAEIAGRLGWEAVTDLFPDLPAEPPQVLAGKRHGGRGAVLDLLRSAPLPTGGQGSNNWVVSGARTASGKPLLANDPHLLAQLPSVWFEIHLTAPGVDVAGVTLPFAPGVTIGHNDRIAWGFTNVGGDTQDLYLERLNEAGTAALYEGGWEPLTVHREEIDVRNQDPVVAEVRETRHGPILTDYLVGVAQPEPRPMPDTYALRWVGAVEGIMPLVTFRMNTARTFEEFREAVREWHSPGQNMVYADIDGHIGYQCTGLHPVRRRGDGTVPVPGWTAEFEWGGWVPFDELPWALDPEEGFLATANNRPHDDSYPWLLGKDFLPPFRARRVAEMIAMIPVHDRVSFARMQMDTASLAAVQVVPYLATLEPETDRQARALALIRAWNCDLSPDSSAGAIYQLWSHHLAERILRPRLGDELFEHYHGRRQWTNAFQYQALPRLLQYPSARWFGEPGRPGRDRMLRQALDDALDELTARLGEDMAAWSWGSLHTVRFAGQLAMIPDLADLFTAGVAPIGGDEQTVLQSMYEPGPGTYEAVVVPSWRQILDPSDWDASVGTHTTGQSGNPASEHFADLFPLWTAGEHHPLPFTEAAVQAAAAHTLTLLPTWR